MSNNNDSTSDIHGVDVKPNIRVVKLAKIAPTTITLLESLSTIKISGLFILHTKNFRDHHFYESLGFENMESLFYLIN